MQLALFTPGAYIWPVHRSFEAFIAALGTPAADAPAVTASGMYPARIRTDSVVHGFAPRLDERLRLLHRELYDALLRPASAFKRESRSIAEISWPDLTETAAGRLLAAFYFFFVRRDPSEMGLVPGLSVLRAVFFSHESAEPEIWLLSALDRLRLERAAWHAQPFAIDAPALVRLSDLHFAAQTELHRPLTSPAWITGRLKRRPEGQVEIHGEFGLDPSRAPGAQPAALARLAGEVATKLGWIFGWQEVAA